MPKANKHAEVKPSKYRTALCEFYLRQEACPFGTRCAFAHGEHELRTEERNLKLLKDTGLRRVDAVISPTHAMPGAMSTENPLAAFIPSTTPLRRQSVIISLPFWSEAQTTEEAQEDPVSVAFSANESGCPPVLSALTTDARRARCRSKFSTTCSTEAPLMYRHNPYGLSTQHY